MLIAGTFTICPRAVALYAHRIARRYASATTPYRLAFKWGMKEATDFAMGVRDIAVADAAAPSEVREARDELLFWQCQRSYSEDVRANIGRASEAVFAAELQASVKALESSRVVEDGTEVRPRQRFARPMRNDDQPWRLK